MRARADQWLTHAPHDQTLSNLRALPFSREQGFGARVARSVENFEHVMRLEEMARQRMSRRAVAVREDHASGAGGADTDTGKQEHHLRDLIISEASDWQVLTLYLAVHMQELRYAIGGGASNAGQLARDALEIHTPLAHRLGVHHLSAGLEDLAFEALYPAEYDEIRRSTEARMGVYQEVMESAKSAVSAALRKDKAFTSQVRRPLFSEYVCCGACQVSLARRSLACRVVRGWCCINSSIRRLFSGG